MWGNERMGGNGIDQQIDATAVVEAAPIGRFQIWACVCCAMILFVDGFDTQVMGFILPQIAKAWTIPHDLLGPIFSSGLIGLFVGYLCIAPLSGRFGHRRTMAACAAIFGVVTLLTTLARDPYSLMVARFLTGIGLGGALPSALAMVGEIIPSRNRSTAVTLVISGLSLGSTCAGLTAAVLLKAYGWQTVLIVGGLLPLFIALILTLSLPETFIYYLAQRGDQAAALSVLSRIDPSLRAPGWTGRLTLRAASRSSSAIELLRNGRAAGTIALWAMIILNLVVNYALQNWLTTLLVQLGRGEEVAIAATTMINAGGILSGFVVGPLMDRFGVYRILAALFIAAALFVAVMGNLLTGATSALLASSFAFGFCSNGLQKGNGAMAIHFYPAALRSTGTGWMFGVGRVGAIIGPLAVGSLLALHWTPLELFYLGVGPMLIGGAVVIVMATIYARRPDQEDADSRGPRRDGRAARDAFQL
jgi:MFS transporter, AAHS family, 4-hydroxybenzoate transporter